MIPLNLQVITGISGLVVEYIVAIDVTRVRFPADAFCFRFGGGKNLDFSQVAIRHGRLA